MFKELHLYRYKQLQLTVVNNIVNAAKADLEEMKIKIKEFEATRFNGETSTAEALQRYSILLHRLYLILVVSVVFMVVVD